MAWHIVHWIKEEEIMSPCVIELEKKRLKAALGHLGFKTTSIRAWRNERASLLTNSYSRTIFIYQPHGFQSIASIDENASRAFIEVLVAWAWDELIMGSGTCHFGHFNIAIVCCSDLRFKIDNSLKQDSHKICGINA